MEPRQGDRINILNVPDDRFKDLYTQGTIDKNWNDETVSENGNVYFLTGYVPYKDNGHYSISGSGHTVKAERLKFIGIIEAKFWRFKNGIRRAHNGEHYTEKVNLFEVDHKDLN